ncbi:MAG: PEP-CTERM sorting domain-containing protein [Akkermansiaceae bacterium]|nr:PEP-CTERM sorting domain-containing protein [Akkermansiaceae bacterium]
MKKTIQTAPLGLLLGLGLVMQASAAITYVDVDPTNGGNTTLTTGGAITLGGNSGTDNNWRNRTDAGLLSNVLEASTGSASNTENVPILRTTISGLTDGQTYQIYGYWHSSSAWDVRLGLAEGSLTPYGGTSGNPGTAIANPNTYFANGGALGLPTSYATLRESYLGTATATGGGIIYAFVDDIPNGETGAGTNGSSGQGRTFFDGFGYQLVPEPSTVSMGAVALLALATRRRRNAS